ncbi:MAG TPA: PIG-L family deacetylase [Rhizomicrobium sp.]|nr:PIG-L family deacetylase [Rhizomicrobium sp.]
MTRILAFHAHPDDVETLGAGTLALLAANGHLVTIATMTAGDCGSVDHSLEETARIRQAEAASAAALIGADYHCAGIGDLCVFNDDTTRRRATELIRAVNPDIVITASPADYHPDHEATSALVRDACFAAPVPNYKTGPANVLDTIPHLYFMDPIGGRDREGNPVAPDFGVDVTAHFSKKRDMLMAHVSQRNWVLKQHGIDDYIGSMEKWTTKRGGQYGVAYAEGFRQYTGTPYPRTQRLQELVGGSFLTI